MNTVGGYTRQYRRLWDHPAFRDKREAAVFSWMKDVAQWRAGTTRTRYGPVALEVGELLISERAVAADFGLHRNTLRALIRRMVEARIISLKRDQGPRSAGTIVHIVNYKEYQAHTESHPNGQDHTQDQARTTLGPPIKIKEGEEEDSESPEGDSGADAPGAPGSGDMRRGQDHPPLKPDRDPVKRIWARGVAQLGESSRSLIGKMRREYGDLRVMEVIVECERECPSEPVEFFIGALQHANRKQGPITTLWEAAMLAADDFNAKRRRQRDQGSGGAGDEIAVPLLGRPGACGEPPRADRGLDRGFDRVRV